MTMVGRRFIGHALGLTVATSLVLAGLALRAPALQANDPRSAREIVERTFENLYGFSSIQKVEIQSRSGADRTYVRRAQVVRQGAAAGLNRMLIRFDAPGDLRDTALLLLEQPDHSYLSWIYQPMFRRTRSISMAQRHDRVFGTDLAFEDLEARRATDWSARMLGQEETEGRHTWKIELKPDGIPSAYDRMVGWFDRERPLIVRLEAYRAGALLKVITIDPEDVDRRGDYTIPKELVIRSGDATETIVRLIDVRVVRDIPETVFTRNALEQNDAKSDIRWLPRASADPTTPND